MESKFDVDVLEAVCMGHNTGVYIEQDAPQLESQMDKGVEEITVTVPAGELQWGYKDSGEPPTVEVEPNNGQDQAIEYFDAPLHHNVPLEHDVIQDMYSYAQEKAGVGNPVNQEMFNEMSALQAIQYCTAKGFIFIHADNELFIPFHESTVMVINAMLKSFTHTKVPRITHDYLSGVPVPLMVMKPLYKLPPFYWILLSLASVIIPNL
jgi:hypothetical protein